MESSKPKLLITGINGYIGAWVTLKALETEEYSVRGTVRDKDNKEKMDKLREALGEKFDELELVNADLLDPDSLKNAVDGCEYILHVASPLPAENPKNEDEVIKPAVEGTLSILKACKGNETVKRVVITSSCVAIFDFTKGSRDVDEENWAEVTPHITAYFKSKILAERAAWDFMDELSEEEKTFEMLTVNPGLVLGPLLTKSSGSSQSLVTNIVTGKLPGLPAAYFPGVDVRDVADGHIKALKAEAGKRYALTENTYKITDLSQIIHDEFSPYGYKVTNKQVSVFLAWMLKFFNKDMRAFYAGWDLRCHVKNDRSINELGMSYIPIKQSAIDMVHSLIKFGFVEDKINK